MSKVGLIVLIGSLVAAALLFALWLVGFLAHVGGALIHLLLVLALPVGFIGGLIGMILIVVGKTRSP